MLVLLFLISVCYCNQVFAQNNDAATYFAKFITAQKYKLGDGLPKDTIKAFELYKDCAENGNMPDAMVQLGIMYKKGQGTSKKLSKALHWFSKSVEKENPAGMCQLGALYKMGEGVEQNFQKAFEYFKASAEKDNPNGMYAAGYCSFKGLGIKQDYQEAVKWFKKGLEKNNAPCIAMLGTCYRNGYGVDENEQEAIKLLNKASAKGVKIAEKELKMKNSEKFDGKPKKGKNKSNGKGNNSKGKEKFKQLIKHQRSVALEGTWTGERYFYDWSRQHILGQESLTVILKQSGNKLKGEWIESGEKIVKFEGTVIDGQIVFSGSKFNGKTRYQESIPMEFTFGRFEAIAADVNYLAGNIESYSPKTKEPGRPCYVVMSRLMEKTATIDSTQVVYTKTNEDKPIQELAINNQVVIPPALENKQEEAGVMKNEALDYFKEKDAMMKVYPNPFKNEMNISYKISSESKASIFVYNSSGSLVLQKTIGIQQQGNHLEKIRLNAPPGQYFVRLVVGEEAFSEIVIKQ